MLSTIDKQYAIDAWRLSKMTPHPHQPNITMFDFMAALHQWSLDSVWAANTTSHPKLAKLIAYGHDGAGAVTWHRRVTNEMEALLQLALGNSSFGLPLTRCSCSRNLHLELHPDDELQ